ncbi:MAG: 50S ribosomal protein L5 [Candidatus Undinarchaeales archaeon]|jgi:large subunit ribosomal protein L5|nr:50S ribosomal protein L5 [Candidatus Undinarchaeales archaeon]MDP7493957.1 50S ribosomal protein L5 [Candidatus Undinarchaeales archaeon]
MAEKKTAKKAVPKKVPAKTAGKTAKKAEPEKAVVKKVVPKKAEPENAVVKKVVPKKAPAKTAGKTAKKAATKAPVKKKVKLPPGKNPMRQPYIDKITFNIGIGAEHDLLERAIQLLEQLTGQQPVKTSTIKRIPTWGIRPGQVVGAKVTIRHKAAEALLVQALGALENKLKARNFDNHGNLSFGIRESLDIPDFKYDPKVGVFGMDVCVSIARPGYRVKARRFHKNRVSEKHLLTQEEGIAFMKERFKVEVN